MSAALPAARLVAQAAGERQADAPVGRALAVCGSELPARQPWNPSFGTTSIHGIRVLAGVVAAACPAFDPASEEHAASVLVRVRAFSCNFRDRGLLLQVAAQNLPRGYWVVGSELAGEVLAVGRAVSGFVPGDRVMGNNAWVDGREHPEGAGLPTNHAAREYLVLPAAKLAPVPAGMPWETAAAFSLGAQTAYAMVRKAQVGKGSHVLVTSARSNTSLFVIAALRTHGARVYAATTVAGWEDRLQAAGADHVFVLDRDGGSFEEHPGLGAAAKAVEGFDAVLDPYADLHLARSLPVLAFGGRYVTCGVHRQLPAALGGEGAPSGEDWSAALRNAVFRNLRILGNCLGTRADLERASADWLAGRFPVPIDSVYRGDDAAPFLDRTYNAPDRFGKVVFSYV